ncbi:hypothetical protein N9O22_03740 [Gammaproteobacteria bacterium]|nr:hypothetical protein [Gammaproteobacteria bacterium]
MISNKKNGLTYCFVIVSFLLTSIFLFRGLFTPLGEESFGRIWHYFINWNDFGFLRRALFGTILEVTKITTFIRDPYFLAYFIYLILLIAVFILLSVIITRSKIADQGPLFLFGMIFSPGLLMQFGYTTGNLDVLLFLFLIIVFFFLTNTFIILILITISLLIHEMFISFIPFFIFFKYLSLQQISVKNLTIFFKPTIVLILSTLICLAIIVFGTLEIPQIEFEALIQDQLGRASFKHPLWSGFYEVSSSVNLNISEAHELNIRYLNELSAEGLFMVCIPFFYLICLIMIFYKRVDITFYKKVLAILTMLLPLMLFLFANDLYRWVGLSIKLCFVAFIFLASENKISFKKIDGFVLSIFVFTGPYGIFLLRPLPAFQFIFDYIF